MALPECPGAHTGPFTSVPEYPCPEESPASRPDASLKPNATTGPAKPPLLVVTFTGEDGWDSLPVASTADTV